MYCFRTVFTPRGKCLLVRDRDTCLYTLRYGLCSARHTFSPTASHGALRLSRSLAIFICTIHNIRASASGKEASVVDENTIAALQTMSTCIPASPRQVLSFWPLVLDTSLILMVVLLSVFERLWVAISSSKLMTRRVRYPSGSPCRAFVSTTWKASQLFL